MAQVLSAGPWVADLCPVVHLRLSLFSNQGILKSYKSRITVQNMGVACGPGCTFIRLQALRSLAGTHFHP